MAPSSGHLLVPKAMRLVRFAIEKTTRALRDKVPLALRSTETLEPAYARIQKKPNNHVAAVRQSQSRHYSSTHEISNNVRHYSSKTSAPSRGSYQATRTGAAVRKSTSRVPFASTLRPSLTGGTLCRSAGGYGLGSGKAGVRYFSHSPAAPAQVVQNVSQAVRAFWLSGQRARFDGVNPRTGEKRYRSVSPLQDEARHKMDTASVRRAGAYVDFKVSPTITAIGPLSTVPRSDSFDSCSIVEPSLNDSAVMSTLSIDFARALKDLAAIMNDLKHLQTLGDLPISLESSTTLRVHFPGCDADTVESLCRELNVRRGIVGEDEDFEVQHGTEMALLFPFAPSKSGSAISGADGYTFNEEEDFKYDYRPTKRARRHLDRDQDRIDWQHMLSPSGSPSPARKRSRRLSQSVLSEDQEMFEVVDNPWARSPSGYSSLHPSDAQDNADVAAMFFEPNHAQIPGPARYSYGEEAAGASEDILRYEGVEGIYRFIEECDGARR